MTAPTTGEVLIVDNYDSFTYNLAQQVAQCTGRRPTVVRNDVPLDDIDWERITHVILSPGPGAPDVPKDVGICADILERVAVPVLGVCLGHQLLATHFGGRVRRAAEPMHGRVSTIQQAGDALFAGLPPTLDVVRYHSLAVSEVPSELRVTSSTHDGVVMGLRHVDRPLWGVQFHPESVLSRWGLQIIANFLAMDTAEAGDSANSWWVDLRRVRKDVSPAVVHEALYKDDEKSFWLDSNSDDSRSEMSVMGSCEGVLSHVLTYHAGSGTTLREFANGRQEQVDGDIFRVVEDELARFDCLRRPRTTMDFCLGYVGYLGYGLKADTCAVADPTPSTMPDSRLTFVERAVVFDHRNGEFLLLALRSGDPGSLLDVASKGWIEATERRILGFGTRQPEADIVPADIPDDATLESEFRFRHDRRSYVEKIRESQELIGAGESYEICLTNMLEFPGSVDPYETYSLLRKYAQVPYGAFLRYGDFSVLSASPECFLTVGADGSVETRPIKGTRPRGRTEEEDQLLKKDLLSAEKDRAENLMIVDLMRNDLNSVCREGSVHVPTLFDVESFPSVHQLISTVRGSLRPGSSPIECLRATFPGGSMTGAPKVRTLQIIDELEEGPRGIYSGAIGWISLSGALALNIVIRSVVVERDRATFGVGGAITQLSDPDLEYQETLVKSRLAAAALLGAAADRNTAP
ncbi:aminodeoxychorismate synthase component I [Nocardiopsis xinjiangensis]|uniref:aminodeoxychorismate synthase component I n=1 Tax=Nocardiopsis xinjiangensis TaxID=124285 RepID=UPI0003471290|nr:aminodeoxychorismate synthase component I [Nocardiopsis xinjiangensis]